MQAKVFEAINGQVQPLPSKPPDLQPVRLPPSGVAYDVHSEEEPRRLSALPLEEVLNRFLNDGKKVHCIGQSECMDERQRHTTVTVLYE